MCASVVMQMLRGCKQYVDGLQNINDVSVEVGTTENSLRAIAVAASATSSSKHTQPAEIMISPVCLSFGQLPWLGPFFGCSSVRSNFFLFLFPPDCSRTLMRWLSVLGPQKSPRKQILLLLLLPPQSHRPTHSRQKQ